MILQEAADAADVASPETYVGAERAENFASPGGADPNRVHAYTIPAMLRLNQWALAGEWRAEAQDAVLAQAEGGISYRFHARDLHLVLGPSAAGTSVRFWVSIDDQPPGAGHGADTDASGNGVVDGERLYQLVRLSGPMGDHVFTFRFLDPGATAYSFTFG